MAHLYHVSSSILPSPRKDPSSIGSGLGENIFSASSNGLTSVGEMAAAHVDPGPERKKKVIVIGAGISGLRAAAVLLRHDVDVVVLEGRDRIGGRINTTRTEKGVPDIGAAWMHETSQNKLVKLIPQLKIDYYYDDGMALYYTEQGRAGAQFKAKKVADEFAEFCEYYYETYPDAPDRSVADFMQDWIGNHQLITADERAWAPQALKEVEEWIGTSVELASAKNLSYFITERNLYMKGGYDGVVNWTAQSLLKNPDTIFLNHVVERIVWSEDGSAACLVEYREENGSVSNMEADAVVSTIPLGALHHNLVKFEPALPDDIQHGLSKFSYGALGKVFFEFSDVFWSKDNDQFIFYPSPPEIEDNMSSGSLTSNSSMDLDNILNYATVTINLWIMTGANELCVQIAEPLTQRIEAMHDKRTIYKFFEPLFKLLRTEPYKSLPKLVDVETTKWTQDPLAGYGSYSADKVGDDAEILIEALSAHRGSRLQFAGEHCTLVANGCVHGAFATGETAAKNLLESFNLEYDGGDFLSQN